MAPMVSRNRTAEHSPHVARLKVLLVDEDSTDLDGYAAVLREQGYEVQTRMSFMEGARCLESGVFDFIVVSQGSRAFEGRVVLERAVEIDRRTPVLVLARWHDMGCYLEAMQLGAVDYVEKPITPLDMARVVTTHLRPPRMAA